MDADEVNKRFDAVGKGVRAGVDPEDAARLAGLPDVDFTGATPVALRLPEEQARTLEDK
ncbi:hypothetical protein [Tomitella gaofuii]|uniref:hypothetical protein n=1 Tax=Tomitella gaofuii TaxID=2760083 RepID=UPI0015F9A9BB|nr:hypothetical protein [Tomitella gaofuii]